MSFAVVFRGVALKEGHYPKHIDHVCAASFDNIHDAIEIAECRATDFYAEHGGRGRYQVEINDDLLKRTPKRTLDFSITGVSILFNDIDAVTSAYGIDKIFVTEFDRVITPDDQHEYRYELIVASGTDYLSCLSTKGRKFAHDRAQELKNLAAKPA